jgi:hypothetical protein
MIVTKRKSIPILREEIEKEELNVSVSQKAEQFRQRRAPTPRP